MVSTYIRIDDAAKWSHEMASGAIRVKTKGPFARDVNALYRVSGNILVDNEAAIQLQILNILGTPIGTEDFEPLYGSNLPLRLFEPITDTMAFLISNDTIDALRSWMFDRIRLIYPGTEVVPYKEEDCYIVNIKYEIIASQHVSDFGFKLLR